jgi:hypothetical protein
VRDVERRRTDVVVGKAEQDPGEPDEEARDDERDVLVQDHARIGDQLGQEAVAAPRGDALQDPLDLQGLIDITANACASACSASRSGVSPKQGPAGAAASAGAGAVPVKA